MSKTIFTNASVILEDRVVRGTVAFSDRGILDVSTGGVSFVRGVVDVDGDYICPGFIEMHTDNAERHFEPRPGVIWPNPLSAILTHDAQIAAAGITTVYDSVCAGYSTAQRKAIFPRTMNAIIEASNAGVFRVDHKIHIRCELTGDDLIEAMSPFIDHPLVKLASLMDHTPGQRQWRDLEAMQRFHVGIGDTLAEHQRNVAARMEQGPLAKAANLPRVLEMIKSRNIPFASHDDTTRQDVEEAAALGAVISEFPTTLEAAEAAFRKGLGTIAGAPNVVRGGSHSSGIAVQGLIEAGFLDGLSSDYVPSSLLQAVIKLSSGHPTKIAHAMAMITWKVADMLGLKDRGRLKAGLLADLVRFRVVGSTPVVISVWRGGERVH